MKGPWTTGFLVLGLLLPLAVPARAEQFRNPPPRWIRWHGSADWGYYDSTGSSQGAETSYTSLRQKYSIDMSGFLWDPRLNRFSLGLDLFRTDRDSEGVEFDSEGLGYRAQTTFFPNRPFPLRLYARRSSTDTSGVALASQDRETDAWGVEWQLATQKLSKFRLLFGRTSFDLLSPVTMQERRKTGLLDLVKKFKNNEIMFRYNLNDHQERINGSAFDRHTFLFTNRSRFKNQATWYLNTQYIDSNARFSSGITDQYTTNRLSTRLDLPRGDNVHIGIHYDFNDNDGKFVDSTSHIFKSTGRFRLGYRWDSLGSISLGRIENTSSTGVLVEDLAGVRTGLQFHQDWRRWSLRASYSIGYDEGRFNTLPDRNYLSQTAGVDFRVPLNGSDEFFVNLSYVLDDNDTTGVGFTRDEFLATAGWEGKFRSSIRFRGSATYRQSIYDTFQFGVQESEEISVDGSLNFPNGGFFLTLSSSEGVSDFFPDPGSSSPFLPGTDLVNRADTAALGFHWRFLRNLRFRMQGRFEDREFTTIGKERILSYHPQIDYNLSTWQFSLGYSSYERNNSTDFNDNTLLLKISKRFF